MEKKGRYHVRAFLQGQCLPEVMMRTADFIQTLDDTLGARFRLAGEFMAYDIEDAFSASVDALKRCGFFPYAELMYEFDAFQTLLLQGAFKSSRDSLRRMLDVCLTSVVYLLQMRSEEEARRWITSDAETPQFSRIITNLKQNQYVAQLDQRFGFTDGLKTLYWHLSDYCHSRGIEFSTGIHQGSEMNYNGVIMRGFNERECTKAMEDFVSVVEQLLFNTPKNILVTISLNDFQKFESSPKDNRVCNEDYWKEVYKMNENTGVCIIDSNKNIDQPQLVNKFMKNYKSKIRHSRKMEHHLQIFHNSKKNTAGVVIDLCMCYIKSHNTLALVTLGLYGDADCVYDFKDQLFNITNPRG